MNNKLITFAIGAIAAAIVFKLVNDKIIKKEDAPKVKGIVKDELTKGTDQFLSTSVRDGKNRFG